MLWCFHVCMHPCLYVLPEGGGFNRCWPFRRDFDSRSPVRHRSCIGHAVANEGFRHRAVMGKRGGGLRGDTGVCLGLIEYEQERNVLAFQKLDGGGGRP